MLDSLQVARHSILQPGMVATALIHLITMGSPGEPTIRQLVPDCEGRAVVAVGLIAFPEGLHELALQTEELCLVLRLEVV